MTSREQTIVRLWREGVTAEEIGRVVDLRTDAVRKEISMLRKRGVDLPRHRPRSVAAKPAGPRLGTPYDQMRAGTWGKTA